LRAFNYGDQEITPEFIRKGLKLAIIAKNCVKNLGTLNEMYPYTMNSTQFDQLQTSINQNNDVNTKNEDVLNKKGRNIGKPPPSSSTKNSGKSPRKFTQNGLGFLRRQPPGKAGDFAAFVVREF
jgi:hypothetical protein